MGPPYSRSPGTPSAANQVFLCPHNARGKGLVRCNRRAQRQQAPVWSEFDLVARFAWASHRWKTARGPYSVATLTTGRIDNLDLAYHPIPHSATPRVRAY